MSSFDIAEVLLEHSERVALTLSTIMLIHEMGLIVRSSPVMNRTIRLLVDVTVRFLSIFC